MRKGANSTARYQVTLPAYQYIGFKSYPTPLRKAAKDKFVVDGFRQRLCI
jgi:hypothetical protein